MSGHTYTHIHTYIHTYTHDNYYNPRCAHAHRGLISAKILHVRMDGHELLNFACKINEKH